MDKRIACYQNQKNIAQGSEILMPKTLGILLVCCKQGNIEKIKKGIAVLREGLDFSRKPLTALRLCQIYHQIECLAQSKDFDGTARLLNQLLSFFQVSKKKRVVKITKKSLSSVQ